MEEKRKNRFKDDNDFEKTKVISTDEIEKANRRNTKKTNNKVKSTKKNKKKKKHPRFWLAVKIMLIIMILVIVVGAGVFAGTIMGLFGDEFKLTEADLLISYSNSVIVDEKGKIIATLNGEENREIISKDDMPKYLPLAFVAIEDERFFSHSGVDWKRTAAATMSFAIGGGESSFGGSTITQQLVKNITKDDEDTGMAGVFRKAKEISKAYQVEKLISKDEILELYLNIIFLGGTSYGVEVASHTYFDKSASDLSIAESAFLAGMTHSPNNYNPFAKDANMDEITRRTKRVLGKMKELNFINEDDYNKSIKEVDKGLKFKEGKIEKQNSYSYHTEALITQILDQLVEEKGMDREYAKKYLYGGGFTIYSTENSKIQDRIEEEHNKSKYIITTKTKKNDKGKLENQQTQAATVIIDQKTGYVLGAVGGLGKKTAWGTNRINVPKQTGSSMKPIAVIAPSLEKGLITAGSVVDDVPISRYNGKLENWYVKGGAGYKGLSNIRYMLRISQNTTEAQLLEKLTPIKSIEFLRELGITSLVTSEENKKANDENLSLALGGITYGVSPLEMAAAYATIANDGEYIEPTFYSKVVDSKNNVILEPNQEKRRVLSEENAFIMQSLLTESMSTGGERVNNPDNGTGLPAKIPGMQTCGKTGTTNEDFTGWFCGFTPYYTGATWYGYDYNARITSSTSTTIWAAIMKDLHKDLKNKSFEQPKGVTTAKICKDSGLLATDECSKDPRGTRVYTEYFKRGTVPTDYCECHVSAKVCKKTGKLPSDDCEETEEKIFITRENADKEKAWKKAKDAKYMLPTDECKDCAKAKDDEKKKQEEEERRKKEEEEQRRKEEEENNQQDPEQPAVPEEPTEPTEPSEPEEPNKKPTKPEESAQNTTPTQTKPTTTPEKPTKPANNTTTSSKK